MNLPSTIINVIVAANLVFQGWMIPGPARQNSAEWCQCVIFVLNILGIKQIPGEYWTAASLAESDRAGNTWMDYQGYTQRADDDLPRTGDLLVLSNGAEVITVQTWDGSEHLVPVLVDVWAGHLGIVLKAEPVLKEGTNYFQIHLLSANWGVSSHSLGVVGSCFNVDESSFLIPVAYKKASFFYASDPVKTRERIINRAKRWALLGLAANSQSSLDGFPITPSGFISHILEPVGENPITPVISDIQNALVEILPTGALPGDILVFGEEKNPGLGVITRINSGYTGDDGLSLDVISMLPGKKVVGPDTWQVTKETGGWSAVNSEQNSTSVRFFRYKAIPDYPALWENIQITRNDNVNEYQTTLRLTNGGIGKLVLHDIELITYPVTIEEKADTTAGIHIPLTDELTLKPGEKYSFTSTIHLVDKGQYRFELQSSESVNPFWLEDPDKTSVIIN
jgi:hypothetical protein